MSLETEIKHECDSCGQTAKHFFCANCLEAEKKEDYDKGFSDGEQSATEN